MSTLHHDAMPLNNTSIIVVSQSRIYELMLEDDAQARRQQYDRWNVGKQSNAVVAGFLCLGLSILSVQ